MPRKSLYMHFVDDRLRRWPSEWCVAFPFIQTCIDDHAFHCCGGIVTLLTRRVSRVVSRNGDSAAVRVEQDFGRVKTQAFSWIEWPVDPISIDLTRPQVRNEDVPVVISAVGDWIQSDHV